ncbi:GNAT family N-acetyltransferase [Sphingomonas sp. MS122]|uniref:bifunctional acetate--CoA ligase family protein/GNAT family N-acetyltransferase n=1 Tax=Sphingomonas sp. MS122 TaxID=3412683 RepID=UPI003C2E243F
MSIRNLDKLLRPRSVAIVGASSRAGTVGQRVLENVLDGGFDGPVFTVNPKQVDLDGDWCVPSVGDLPIAPDLAIIVTPARTVPGIVAELGAKGTRLAVVISSGFHEPELRQAILDAARPHLLRVVGPNCLGVMMPHARLNGSFAQAAPRPGGLALISQSGALVTSMIDWANARDVGFSGIVSLGDAADADFGDLIDLFAADPKTDAIALYVESISDPAKFMSAARAAAGVKPVVALKAGRTDGANRAALTHTGALGGSYDAHLAAFRRAGIVSVETLTELFDATQVLARRQLFRGNSLAIVTNGGGAGVLAADALQKVGGHLAQLAPATITTLDAALPRGWSRANPIDVVGDARAERFVAGIEAAAADPHVDAVLVMHCPTAVAAGTEIAQVVADQVAKDSFPRRTPVLACWMGPHNADAARAAFAGTGIPLFDNLDDAVRGFGYLIAARAARESLMRAPARLSVSTRDRGKAMAVISGARVDRRTTLTATEAKAILEAFGVPIHHGRFAQTTGAIWAACALIDPPYALKIVSRELTHKSDVGGVALDLPDAASAVHAAEAMAKRIAHEHPSAKLLGFEVEPMVEVRGKHELLVGMYDDPTFGPMITVGAGGKAVEVIADRALGLPPLDDTLAREMILQTRIARLLAGYRDEPAADIDALVRILNAVARIAAELPDIAELDINPLVLDENGALVLDARMRITAQPARSRMVIRPVPVEWTTDLTTREGVELHVRPVTPDDEPELADFFREVSSEDLRFRFLSAIHEVGHERLAAMTQIDYRRAMHFLAFAGEVLVASAFLVSDPDRTRAELAISVRAGWKHKGISWSLLQHMLRYAESEGVSSVESLESSENHAALQLEREMGFTTTPCPDSPTETLVRKVLRQPEAVG